jgi:hypothetical protein
MYYPQPQREPSGCMEALLISRIVFGMLLIPFLMILGAIGAVVVTLLALTVHPLLALLSFALCGAVLILVAKWESARVKRQLPPEDN